VDVWRVIERAGPVIFSLQRNGIVGDRLRRLLGSLATIASLRLFRRRRVSRNRWVDKDTLAVNSSNQIVAVIPSSLIIVSKRTGEGRNSMTRRLNTGGYYLITTAACIDQQQRGSTCFVIDTTPLQRKGSVYQWRHQLCHWGTCPTPEFRLRKITDIPTLPITTYTRVTAKVMRAQFFWLTVYNYACIQHHKNN